MNPAIRLYIEPSHQNGFNSDLKYQYGDKVKIVSAGAYLDWTEAIVIRAESNQGNTRYLVRCFPNGEELWLNESQICPLLNQGLSQNPTQLFC